jgi:TonB family protein
MAAISRHKMFVVIAMLCAIATTISPKSDLFCSCMWMGPFMVAADNLGSVIVYAKILGYSEKKDDRILSYGDKKIPFESLANRSFMDIEVHEVFKGTIPAKKLSVLAGMGLSHIPPYAVNSDYILVLRENPSGYSISSCGPFGLIVIDGKVIGNITDLHFGAENQEMPLTEFTKRLKEIVTPSMPKAFIHMPGSAKPAIHDKNTTPPLLLESPAPPYPEEAKRRNIEGNVVVHVIVRKDGAVDSPVIIGSVNHDLDESALGAISSRWQFAPGTVSGEPADFRTIIRYSFRFDSPLRVAIIEDHWEFGFGNRESTVGHGNLIENGTVRGFEFTIPEICEFGKKEYPAVWRNPQSDLEMRVYSDTSGQPHLYKLRVKMKDFMYQKKDDELITLPIGTAESQN